MLANEQAYMDKAKGASLTQVVDPPLTVKISDMLDEAFKRLNEAEITLRSLNGRLFSDEDCANACGAAPMPSDFSSNVTMRLQALIGLSGDLMGAANRLNNRL